MARASDFRWYCPVCDRSFMESQKNRHLGSKGHKARAEKRGGGGGARCSLVVSPHASPNVSFVEQERALVLRQSDRLPWAYECLLHAMSGSREAAASVPRLSGKELEIALAFAAVVQKFPWGGHRVSHATLRRLRRQKKALPPPPSPKARILGHLGNMAALRKWMRVTGTLRSVLALTDSAAEPAKAAPKKKKKSKKKRPRDGTRALLLDADPENDEQAGAPDWRGLIGYTNGPLFTVLSHLATDYNDAQARRHMANRGIERRIEAPDATFVCIGNNGRNGATNLLSRMQSQGGCVGRLDPVVLFIDRLWWKPLGPHPLYVLHEEHVRRPVGHLSYVPWTEAAQGADFACERDTGVLLWRGSPVGWVEVDHYGYNGQLVPGSYCQWTWDRDRGTYVEATRTGTVHIGLPRDHALVRASLRRYYPSAAATATAACSR